MHGLELTETGRNLVLATEAAVGAALLAAFARQARLPWPLVVAGAVVGAVAVPTAASVSVALAREFNLAGRLAQTQLSVKMAQSWLRYYLE